MPALRNMILDAVTLQAERYEREVTLALVRLIDAGVPITNELVERVERGTLHVPHTFDQLRHERSS